MKKHPFIFATFLIALSFPIALNVSALDYGLLYVNKKITPQTIEAMFKQPLSILKQKDVAIKVLTPKVIPRPDDFRIGFLAAIPYSDSPNSYSISLATTPQCQGYCYITFAGKKIGEVKSVSRSPMFAYDEDGEIIGGGIGSKNESSYFLTLSEALAKREKKYSKALRRGRSTESPTSLSLSNGTRAVFLPWVGYVNTYSNLSWDDNGVRYEMIMQDGDKATMVKMVNSIYK